MGFKPEVLVGGQWSRNSLVFATEAEALASAKELMDRWMSVTEARVVEVVGEPATHAFVTDEEGVSRNKPIKSVTV
jgi:hypothetical protein